MNKLEDYDFEEALKGKGKQYFEKLEKFYFEDDEEDDDDGDAEELANCRFTLAYGSKVLLHNTKLKIKRGYKYGLLGGNDSGKTTLMRAIANEQVEGFPPASELRTVFVEADIVGELSDLPCVDYILADERIKAAGIYRGNRREDVVDRRFWRNAKRCEKLGHLLIRWLENEVGVGESDVFERRHLVDGRTDEPLGRHERQVGRNLPLVVEERHVHHRVARYRFARPRV